MLLCTALRSNLPVEHLSKRVAAHATRVASAKLLLGCSVLVCGVMYLKKANRTQFAVLLLFFNIYEAVHKPYQP